MAPSQKRSAGHQPPVASSVIAFPCPMGFKTGKAALVHNPKPAFGFTSAANPVPLPKAKPRAVREHFVVPSIRSREVARAQRSRVRHCEDAFKALDFGNCLLGVHSVSISNMSVAVVKRRDTCMSHPATAACALREVSVS
jgi:hypothetical protein